MFFRYLPDRRRTAPSAKQQINIAFVEIENDPRYAPVRAYERIILKTRAHPFTGAELGLDDATPLARVLKADFRLQWITVKSAAEVAPAVRAALDAGTHFFLIDAPAESFKPLAEAVRGRDVTFVQCLGAGGFVAPRSVRARIRPCLSEPCTAHGRARAIRRLAKMARPFGARRPLACRRGDDRTFIRSAQKFGAKIVANQHFKPGTDPREREQKDRRY